MMRRSAPLIFLEHDLARRRVVGFGLDKKHRPLRATRSRRDFCPGVGVLMATGEVITDPAEVMARP